MLNFSADSLLCSSDSEVGDQNFASRLWAHENRDEENRQANHRSDEDRARQGDLLAPSVFISFSGASVARDRYGSGMARRSRSLVASCGRSGRRANHWRLPPMSRIHKVTVSTKATSDTGTSNSLAIGAMINRNAAKSNASRVHPAQAAA